MHAGSYLRFTKLPLAEQDKMPPSIADWCRRIVAENPISLMTAMVEIGPIRRRIAAAFVTLDWFLSESDPRHHEAKRPLGPLQSSSGSTVATAAGLSRQMRGSSST